MKNFIAIASPLYVGKILLFLILSRKNRANIINLLKIQIFITKKILRVLSCLRKVLYITTRCCDLQHFKRYSLNFHN